mmetsp:Transcript_1954/g.2705  ORF Transcript_1954/g.2705 Transcript_1954/m.2705 type:complete len:109 (-) Transcript_1954:113-439(-)
MVSSQVPPSELKAPGIVAYNIHVVHYCRILVSIIAGAACGIIGFTGFKGFIFFLLSWVGTMLSFYIRVGWKAESYFVSQWTLITHDLFQGTLSFILFWTLFNNIVHIY